MKTFKSIFLGIPEILLPKGGSNFSRWAVIACDQYTSEPEYWQRVREIVDESPSTLNLIYPEVYLTEKNPDERIRRIRESMRRYLDENLFERREGFVYVERQTGEQTRKGLMVCLDLEKYDFYKGSTSPIRATEGTILERIPPRVRIREGAPLEIPHIMVLVDDPSNLVLGPVTAALDRHEKIYDFELMMNSGRLAGYRIKDPSIEQGIIDAIQNLVVPGRFCEKYGLKQGTPVLLYAVGDGNHSLATAKTIWEKAKESAVDKTRIMESSLRYAMVELVNLHDTALVFEPIHRVLFDVAPGRYLIEEMNEFFSGRMSLESVGSFETMKSAVDAFRPEKHRIGIIRAGEFGVMEVRNPDSNLPAGNFENLGFPVLKVSLI